MSMKSFQRGEVIFREGDSASCMFDIYWGSVGIYAAYGTGQERLLTELGEGSFFGEMGMIDGEPRSATAVALMDDTRVEEICEEDFADYFRTQPMRILMILRQMARRIRELSGGDTQISTAQIST